MGKQLLLLISTGSEGWLTILLLGNLMNVLGLELVRLIWLQPLTLSFGVSSSVMLVVMEGLTFANLVVFSCRWEMTLQMYRVTNKMTIWTMHTGMVRQKTLLGLRLLQKGIVCFGKHLKYSTSTHIMMRVSPAIRNLQTALMMTARDIVIHS